MNIQINLKNLAIAGCVFGSFLMLYGLYSLHPILAYIIGGIALLIFSVISLSCILEDTKKKLNERYK